MTDNKAKKKADGKRVALKTQSYERRYILEQIEAANEAIGFAQIQLVMAIDRIHAGFPKARRK